MPSSAGHRRPQGPGAGALPVRALLRQRSVDRARRAGPQRAALDATARAARHDRPRRPHPAPPAAGAPGPADPPRPRLDASPPGPLALARRLPQRAQSHPRTPRRRLTATARPDNTTAPRRTRAPPPAARPRPRPPTTRPPPAGPGSRTAARHQPKTLPPAPHKARGPPNQRPQRPGIATKAAARPTSRHPATGSVDPG